MASLFFLASFAVYAGGCVWAIRRIEHAGARGAAIVAFAVLGLPMVIVLGSASAVVANNIRLHQFSSQLERFPLPENARLLSEERQVGVLTGNGDHCDFVATRRIESKLSVASVEAHYARMHLKPAISGGAGGGLPAVEVEQVPGSAPRILVIRAVDAPYEGIFDPRCQ